MVLIGVVGVWESMAVQLEPVVSSVTISVAVEVPGKKTMAVNEGFLHVHAPVVTAIDVIAMPLYVNWPLAPH